MKLYLQPERFLFASESDWFMITFYDERYCKYLFLDQNIYFSQFYTKLFNVA